MIYFESAKAFINHCRKSRNAALLIVTACGFLLASVTASQLPGSPVPANVSQQVQKELLEAQLADLQAIRDRDWSEAQHKKAQYDQYVRDNPAGSTLDPVSSRTIDRVAAEAQQASGRVEMADRLIADLQRRLQALGPGSGRHEEADAEALLEIEGTLLTAEQSAWQPIRASEWETQLKKQGEYNEFVRQHPDYPVDRSGSEANIAIGGVEILDRLLGANSNRLQAIETQMAAAWARKVSAPLKTPKPDLSTDQAGWHQEGAPGVEKSIPKPDACYPSATLDISDGAATGTRKWTECSTNPPKCSGTYVGKVTWTPPPAYMQPGKDVNFTATVGTTASNSCGYRNFGSWMVIKINGGTYVAAGESQYSGPPKATGKFTAPPGKPGAKLLIEVTVVAASLNGKMTYSYIYK